jgi:uncharacterized protein DUF4128
MAFTLATSITSGRRAIEQRIYAWWVTDEAKNAAYIAWPNAPFVTPTGAAWLQVGIQFGQSIPRTFCDTHGQNERVGVLFLTLFGPKGDGFAALDALASRAMAKFERQIAAGVEYSQSDGPRDIGDPALASAQVSIRFRYWETVASGVTP